MKQDHNMDELHTDVSYWICPKDKTKNTENYCPVCGRSRPTEEKSWVCPHDGQTNTGNYCIACGAKKPRKKRKILKVCLIVLAIPVLLLALVIVRQAIPKKEYDSAGNLISKTWYDGFGKLSSIEYFDDAGNLARNEWYGADEKIIFYHEYEYDAAGNCISEASYDSDGTLRYRDDYKDTYVSNTDIPDLDVSDFEFSEVTLPNWSSGTQGESSIRFFADPEYEYDAAGKPIREKWYYSDGELAYTVDYTYNSAGNCIQRTSTEPDGTVSYTDKFEYDSAGTLRKEIHCETGNVVRAYREYDSSGNLTRDAFCISDQWTEMLFDSMGYTIAHNEYHESGSLRSSHLYAKDGSWEEYEYMRDGNPFSYHKYDSNTNCVEMKQYDLETGKLYKHIFYNPDMPIEWDLCNWEKIYVYKSWGNGELHSWATQRFDRDENFSEIKFYDGANRLVADCYSNRSSGSSGDWTDDIKVYMDIQVLGEILMAG